MSHVLSDFSLHENPIQIPMCRDSDRKKKRGAGNRVRLRDARQLYLLVGECRSAGIDGLAWRRHLTKQLRSLFEADLVTFIDKPGVVDSESNDNTIKPHSIVENGSLDSCPTSPSEFFLNTHSEPAQLWEGAQKWHGSRVISRLESMRKMRLSENHLEPRLVQFAGLGEYLLSASPRPDGLTQLLGLFRQPEKPPFSRRVVHLLRALWVELRLFQPDELVGVENSVFAKYPKRMLQVLSCLLAGNTARETAALLSISIHTVQEHTKRLYKRTDTSNRAELAEFFHNVAPLLIETPLDEYPDFQQAQNGIVRDH